MYLQGAGLPASECLCSLQILDLQWPWHVVIPLNVHLGFGSICVLQMSLPLINFLKVQRFSCLIKI